MKKILLLVMVIGLLMIGEAMADGAWVLWESQPNTYPVKWVIIGAYPSYDSCIYMEKFTCEFTSNPCTATNYFNNLASKSRGAEVVQSSLRTIFLSLYKEVERCTWTYL